MAFSPGRQNPPRASAADAPLVLIVDDNEDILVICEQVLRRAGYRTATASSGQEALAKVGELRPGLIILDLMMPGIDGFTTAHEIHSAPETAGIPIAVLTAAPASREEAAYRVGAQAFCTKPIDPARLTAIARRLCPIP